MKNNILKPITSIGWFIKNSVFMMTLVAALLCSLVASCSKDKDVQIEDTDYSITGEPFTNPQYNTEQSISDEAQRNTMAFDALGFMVGNLGAQTFLPPGKVADYSGFQYFRDNDQTKLGHNTSFVTIIAYNILNILSDEQIQMYVDAANDQIAMINEYAYKRMPLCKAFRRLIESDLPAGKTELDKDAVMAYSAELYKIDGEISYNRAKLFGDVINSFTVEQKAKIKALYDLQGIGNWPSDVANKLEGMGLAQDVNVAVMTYASEMYAWYAGSVTADVYFCPERQGTYFGSFYLKDWPAMGNPNYTIDEQLTASAGQNFFDILTPDQYNTFTSVVDLQKTALTGIVDTRRAVSTELRKFLAGETASSLTVQALSEQYGNYDGELIYYYATYFSQIYQSLSTEQKALIIALGNDLGYIDPTGAFLYSAPVAMPTIENTDFLFK
ncbi:MAG: hypothetical protein U0W24_13745 [Bacteroidales bacterium]